MTKKQGRRVEWMEWKKNKWNGMEKAGYGVKC